jgi:hypothetical protein
MDGIATGLTQRPEGMPLTSQGERGRELDAEIAPVECDHECEGGEKMHVCSVLCVRVSRVMRRSPWRCVKKKKKFKGAVKEKVK